MSDFKLRVGARLIDDDEEERNRAPPHFIPYTSYYRKMATRNWRLVDIDQFEDGNLTMEELVGPDPRSPSI